MMIFYAMVAYGATLLLVDGIGPFRLIEKFRNLMHKVPVIGDMLDCYMCTSFNLGWIVILLEQVFNFAVSPIYTIIQFESLIVLAIINALFTTGVVWIVYTIVSLLESKITTE